MWLVISCDFVGGWKIAGGAPFLLPCAGPVCVGLMGVQDDRDSTCGYSAVQDHRDLACVCVVICRILGI